MSLVPVKLGFAFIAVVQEPDEPNSFQLAPSATSIKFSEALNVSYSTINGDHLDIRNIANEKEWNHSRIVASS